MKGTHLTHCQLNSVGQSDQKPVEDAREDFTRAIELQIKLREAAEAEGHHDRHLIDIGLQAQLHNNRGLANFTEFQAEKDPSKKEVLLRSAFEDVQLAVDKSEGKV